MTRSTAVEDRYLRLIELFRHRANVTLDGKGFGSSALKVEGRIFAMLTSRSEFVVKLPRERVDELISSGNGLAYAAGKSRPLREWVVIRPESAESWEALADDALTFCATRRTTSPRASLARRSTGLDQGTQRK